MYTLDSLEGVLKRDFENNGKNPELSDSPEKLLIYVSYDNFESTKLLKTLHKLLETYEKVANKRDIKILLKERIILEHPIPPPPVKLEEIEDEE